MGKKIKYQLIADPISRRITFKKRKGGLLKKLSEIKILCGVDACAIIKNTNTNEQILWPSEHEVHRVLERFHSFPEKKRGENMVNEFEFLTNEISKLEAKLKKEDNLLEDLKAELYLTECFAGESVLHEGKSSDIEAYCSMLDRGIDLINNKIQLINISNTDQVADEEGKN